MPVIVMTMLSDSRANDITGNRGGFLRSLGPVTVVVLAILALWYIFTVILNTPWQKDL